MNTLLDPSFIKKCPMDALRDGLSAVAALTMIFDAPDVGESLNGEDRRRGVSILMESAYGTLRAAYDVLDEEAADEYLRQKRETGEQDAFNRRADAWMRLRGWGVKDVMDCLDELRQHEAGGTSARFEGMWQDIVNAFETGFKNQKERGIDRDEVARRVREGLLKTREFTALRNDGIVKLWRAGTSIQDIATRYELNEKAVERICHDAQRDRINDPFVSGMTAAVAPQPVVVAECDHREQKAPDLAHGVIPREAELDVRDVIVKRNAAIIAARKAGGHPVEIGRRYGITDSMVRRIVREAEAQGQTFPSLYRVAATRKPKPAPVLTEAAPVEPGLPVDTKARA